MEQNRGGMLYPTTGTGTRWISQLGDAVQFIEKKERIFYNLKYTDTEIPILENYNRSDKIFSLDGLLPSGIKTALKKEFIKSQQYVDKSDKMLLLVYLPNHPKNTFLNTPHELSNNCKIIFFNNKSLDLKKRNGAIDMTSMHPEHYNKSLEDYQNSLISNIENTNYAKKPSK